MKRVYSSIIFSIVILAFSCGFPAFADTLYDGAKARRHGDYAMALSILRPLADNGHPLAELLIGLMHEKGEGVTRDQAAARAWKAKAQGHGFEVFWENYDYVNLALRNKDYQEALSVLTPLATQGDSISQEQLGRMLVLGLGVAPDMKEGMAWLTKSAAGGNEHARRMLAEIQAAGGGGDAAVTRSLLMGERAFEEEELRARADAGDVFAQERLGSLYYHGNRFSDGDAGQLRRGVDLLKRAGGRGHVFALEILAGMAGTGLLDDDDAWLRLAASRGVAVAADLLEAKSYFHAKPPKTLDEAHGLYRDAARGGDAEAMFRLCRLGASVSPQRAADALSWCERAAEAGRPKAGFALHLIYAGSGPFEGNDGLVYWGLGEHGPKPDGPLALAWLEKAADGGLPEAMSLLAYRLAVGEDVVADDAKAAEWARRAADAGDVRAMAYLGLMRAKGRGGPRDDAKAMSLLAKAARGGVDAARCALGHIHLHGRGETKPDFVEAASWTLYPPIDANDGALADLSFERCQWTLNDIEAVMTPERGLAALQRYIDRKQAAK